VNIDALAGLVMEKYLRRQLIKAGNEIVHLGFETETELPIVLDNAEQKVFNVTQQKTQSGLVHIGDTLINTFQDIETRHQGIALPGIPCGFYDLDAMTSGFQRSDLIIVAGRPSMGKCLSYDSEIVLANGQIATIEELYQQRQGSLLTLNDDWKFTFTRPSAFVDDGIKPVFRVTTRLGRAIETTITHPFLTIKGWQKLENLQVGDKIAIPRKIDVFGKETIRECEVKLLADSLETSNTKTIPNIVFKLEKSQLSLFLNRLFATDGWATLLNSGQSQLGYCTVSEKLGKQIQHLLLRFGIISALKKRSVKYNNTRRPAWQLDITDALSIKNFIAEIGIFGKEAALAKVTEAISQKRYQTNRDLIPIEIWEQIAAAKGKETWSSLAQRAGIKSYTNIHVGKRSLTRERLCILATALDNLPLQQLANSEVYWDEIIAIESVGNKQVYDLTIPETHNFVANDICVHNTAFCLNLAHNIAAGYQLAVAVFSLEMSKEQLVQRLLAS
ncbi:replicative DNA helicase, partial [Dolichospermum sp. ST_sed9]|nr:replicative DNA helicase [Dolichospermum sp. ST_sed9]